MSRSRNRPLGRHSERATRRDDVTIEEDDKEKDDENEENRSLTFYPAYCHRVSPTWFTWVRLTAWDVHHVLRSRPEIISSAAGKYGNNNSTAATPLVLYYLNHPIQYIQVTGIVISTEPYYETHFLFTIDDSSGSTIQIFYRKPTPKTESLSREDNPSNEKEIITDLTPTLNKLQPGSTVRVKGHISTYHSSYQLNLLRLDVLRDTNAELAQIASRTNFLRTILMKPWLVSVEEQAKLLKEVQGENDGQRRREKKRKQRRLVKEQKEEDDRKIILEEYEIEDKVREQFAEKAKAEGEIAMKNPRKRRK